MATTSGGGDDRIICTVSELEDNQLSSFHSEGHVEKPATLAIETHAALGQGFLVSQEEGIFSNSSCPDQAEEMLFITDDLKKAGIGLYGCNVFSSTSKSQGIYGDLAGIPKSDMESEDISQQCGGQSFVTQLQLQYGVEDIGHRQTSEFYNTNSDENCQQLPTVSTTTYCEDRGKYKLTSSWRKDCGNKVTTSRNIRQQRMSPSQFVPHRVSPTISTGE
jgi:hypothetical protein